MVGADLTYGQLKNAPGVRCKGGRNRSDNVESMSDEERYEPPAADPATNRPTLGIKEAAKACGVHADTIRRAYRKGQFPNSTKGAGGAVLIPITDLLAAGYRLNAPTPGEAVKAAPAPADPLEALAEIDRREMENLREAAKRLEAENARLMADLAKMEAREVQLLDLMGLQLKALNAGTPPENAGTPPQRPQSRPFWRRGRA